MNVDINRLNRFLSAKDLIEINLSFISLVRVLSFAKLCAILSPEHDTTAILKYLQQVAMLVQGNWVVNSELIYPKDSLSSQNSISEFMSKARDYIVSI